MYKQTASEMPAGTEFQTIVKAINLKWKELPLAERKKFENAYLMAREQQAVDGSVGGGILTFDVAQQATSASPASWMTQLWVCLHSSKQGT